jgi:hypothetical protein
MGYATLDDPTRTADAGTLPHDPKPLPHTSHKQAMDVLAGREREDNNYRNGPQWALMVFDDPEFIADMPVDAKRQWLELAAQNPGTRYNALYNYVSEAVKSITEAV